jgi:hypothetical protein
MKIVQYAKATIVLFLALAGGQQCCSENCYARSLRACVAGIEHFRHCFKGYSAAFVWHCCVEWPQFLVTH